MPAAATQRLRQRLFGQREEVARGVPGQRLFDRDGQRRAEGKQFAVAAEVQRGDPGGFVGGGLRVMGMGGVRLPVACVWVRLVLLVGLHLDDSRLERLQRGIQRADMNHQHGEEAKPETRVEVPFAYHEKSLLLVEHSP